MKAVICPRCSTVLVTGRCPKCQGTSGKTESSAAKIPYEFSNRSPEGERSSQWRQELLLRVDRHRQRIQGKDQDPEGPEEPRLQSAPSEEAPAAPPPRPADPDKKPRSGTPSRVFRYRMSNEEAPPPVKKVLTYRTEKRPVPSEKPVIRPLMKPAARTAHDQRQGHFQLNRTEMEEKPVLETDGDESVEGTVFPEILFSRLLGGLIDIVAALIGGGGAVVLTFRLGGLDLFSSRALTDILVGVGVVYLFNSTFFLYLSGQTLGMLATELKLVGEDGEHPSLSDLILRVAVFPLVAASLVGLLWALFDRRQLCWHDYASRTRVVPLDHMPADETVFPA